MRRAAGPNGGPGQSWGGLRSKAGNRCAHSRVSPVVEPTLFVRTLARTVLVLCLASLMFDRPRTAESKLSPATVLALADQGLKGSYEATYALNGQLAVFPGPNWTVIVAHQGPTSAPDPPITEDGTWSFFLHAGDGYQLQWIERGQHFWDCWTMAGRPGWRCGRGTYEVSNGFSLATLPYIPESVIVSLQLRHGAPTRGERLRTTRRASHRFGRLLCLTEVGKSPVPPRSGTTSRHPFVATCLTRRGLVASQRQWGEGAWDSLSLVSWRARPRASDFRPVAQVATSTLLPPL
jgi:hypothetical protein